MRKTFTIIDRGIISRVTAFLEAQPLEPLLEVVVKNHQQDRSLAQNTLLWRWQTFIANEWGWTKDDVHEHFKKNFLARIYERDEPGYAAMIQAVRKVYHQGFKEDAKAMHKQIVRMTSTTSATVRQFTEYLKDIERDMIGKGISLPHKEDSEYDRAMGTKQK